MSKSKAEISEIPVLGIEEIEKVLRPHLPKPDAGCYIKYRAPDITSPDIRWEPICISFKQGDGSLAHNVVYMCEDTDEPWGTYKGWITINPEPWTAKEPAGLISTAQMWPSVEDMAGELPELSSPIDPNQSGTQDSDRSLMRDSAAHSDKFSHRSAESVTRRPRSAGGAGALPSGQWQGHKGDQDLYNILVSHRYALPTAISATASRYGSELPALARIMISHGHIRAWAEEQLDREMETGTPLGLLQSESAVMLLWMLVTEVSGCPFLAMSLGATVGDICKQKMLLEMDPSRTDATTLHTSASKLTKVVKNIVESICSHVEHFPLCCSQILYAVEQSLSSTYGLMANTTISRFLFQRFILEAILAPAAVGVTGSYIDEGSLRTLGLVHQILEKICTPDAEFLRNDGQGRYLVGVNHILPECRTRLDAFTQTVVSMGAPYSPIQPAASENGGVVFVPSDVDFLVDYLKDRFVEVYSAIADLRGEGVAAEVTQRLRPLLFRGALKGPVLPVGVQPHVPHPIGLTNSAYETRVPPPMGTESPAVTAASQRRENALPPPPSATPESLGVGVNSAGTGQLDASERTGVGIIFRKDSYGLFHVLQLTKGGAAQASGIVQVGDVVMEANGRQVVGLSLNQLKQIIVGPVGTPLRMVFERPRGPSSERYEVCLFRGNMKPTTGMELMNPTHAKSEGEDMRVYREMSKLVSEVDELQQRRLRAEKALHAAETLRQEYDLAANESEERAARLQDEINQIRGRIAKVRNKRTQAELQTTKAQQELDERVAQQQNMGLNVFGDVFKF